MSMRTLTQKRRLKGKRGNTLVESALVLWPFLLIVLGLVQIAFVVWSNSTLGYAVNAGVRYASLNGARSRTPANAERIRQEVVANATGLVGANITVNVTWTPDNRPGSVVRVQGSYPAVMLVNLANSFTLRSTSQMLILN
jgi:Flp pilus assembly protein TadG